MRLTTSLRDNIIIFAGENRQMRETAMGDLSAHFSKTELACRCCGELKIEQGLIDALEQLRSLAGTEVLIHDGYRCPAHNQEVGGVTDSEHTRGMAADVGIPGLSLQQMYELALQIPTIAKGGIGFASLPASFASLVSSPPDCNGTEQTPTPP